MSYKQINSESESEGEKELEDLYQDDADFLESKENLSSLIKFPTEAYIIASNTPIGTPTSSPRKSKEIKSKKFCRKIWRKHINHRKE